MTHNRLLLQEKCRTSHNRVVFSSHDATLDILHLTFNFFAQFPSDGAEDLLDQYVKHVENVNRITLEPHVNLGHKKGTPLRTSYYRRSLKSVQDSEERTNEQDCLLR
nr:unnamed protein product [Callosobruchus analis]